MLLAYICAALGGCRGVGDVRHHSQAGQIHLRVIISIPNLVPACSNDGPLWVQTET